VLSNGVSIVTAENHYNPTVTISASIKAGAMRDSDQTAGLAHLVGRMFERGTRARNIYQLAEGFESLGASLKRDTDYLVTSITVNGLKKDAEALIQLLAEMIQSPSFPQAEMEKARTEILTELGEESDDAHLIAEQALRERIYPQGHPFRRNIKGSSKTLEKLKMQDLTSFHKRYYRPDQLIIVVAGDIRTEEVFQWIDKGFAKWTAQGVAEAFSMPAAFPGLGTGEQVVRMNHKSQCEILFGLPGISRHDPDYYPLLILNQILGQSELGGRLGARFRDQEGLACYLSSSFEASLSGGPLVIRAVVNPDRVDPVFSLMKEEIQKIKSDGVTEQEVKAAKSTLINSLPLALEENEGIARQLLLVELFELGEDYLNRFADLVEEVKTDSLLDCSRRRLLFDQAALVIVGPYRQKSK
jgi:zinc protease